MSKMSRRRYVQGTLAALAAASPANPAAVSSTPMRSHTAPKHGIQLAELFALDEEHKTRLAAQIGITHAIVGVLPALSNVPRDRYHEALAKIKADFAAMGLQFAGVESHPVPAEKIKLGLPGRDEEIENYIAAIKALAEIGVPMVCYNWMAGIGWYRTKTDIPARGGALISEFNNDDANKQDLTEWGEVPEA